MSGLCRPARWMPLSADFRGGRARHNPAGSCVVCLSGVVGGSDRTGDGRWRRMVMAAGCQRAGWAARNCWPSSGPGWPGAGAVAGLGALLWQAGLACSWRLCLGRRRTSVRGLDAGQVTSFMIGYCQDRNRWSAKAMVTALRALLRFAARGGTDGRFRWRRRFRRWRGGGWPRCRAGLRRRGGAAAGRLRSGQSPVGRRDYAMLVCWRGSGCAAPRPPGCDWATSTGVPARSWSAARATGSSGSRCPSVGEALATYLARAGPVRVAGRVRYRAAAATGG